MFLKSLHWVGLPPGLRAWAGEDVGSGEWAPAGLGSEGDPARGGVPVLVLLVGVCLPGLGDGLLSLLAYLGWGRYGTWGVGSSGVGVGRGSGVLARGGVPVLVLLVGVCLPGLGDGLLSLTAYLGLGRCGIRGVGSSRVGVGEGAGVLVLRSLWDVLGFERFPAWASWRGAVFLSSSFGWGCVVLVSGVCSFPCWRTCAAGDALATCGSLVFVL